MMVDGGKGLASDSDGCVWHNGDSMWWCGIDEQYVCMFIIF